MLRCDWTDFKFLASGSKNSVRYIDRGTIYFMTIGGAGAPYAYCKLAKSDPPSDEQVEFETYYKPNANKPFENRSSVSGKLATIAESPEGIFETYVTHDFTDKTTWYQNSTRHSAMSAASNIGLVYTLQHNPIIDVEHGKITGEKYVQEHILKVYVAGVLQTSGYTCNYQTGIVTFTSAPVGAVTFDYSVPTDSVFKVKYEDGMLLSINRAEVQFTKDVIFKPMSFSVWIFHQAYQQMVQVEEILYRSIKDVVNISNLGFSVPAFSGMTNDVIIFPFEYQRPIVLAPDLRMEIRIKVIDDTPMVGEFATASLYVSEVPVV